jgi:hypothetical protein
VLPTLNIDLGELPDEPDALFAAAQLANVACGGHAGDRESMERCLRLARDHGVAVGAHPGLPGQHGRAATFYARAVLAVTQLPSGERVRQSSTIDALLPFSFRYDPATKGQPAG